MPIFQSSDLNRFYLQGENEISTERPFIVDRYSFATVAGTGTYQLPDYVTSIRRITFQGWKLDPLPERNFREVFQGSSQQSSRPFWYIFNNVGATKIQLFPAPSITLAAVGSNLWSTGIPLGVIVEFYRPSDGSTFVLPTWIKRQLLKYYVAKRSYSIDGPGFNSKLVKYHSDMWNSSKLDFVNLLDFLYSAPRKLLVDEVVSSNYFPGEPVLPIDQFGISVDEDY